MNRFALFLLALFTAAAAHGQALYSRAFGAPTAPAIVFLHGGPGYNSAGFEATTAQQLADAGYYVVVYDRRGEGRSAGSMPPAAFTFQQTFDDLTALCKKYALTKPALIGHSFGGVVATLYAERYPAQTGPVILVGAPVSLQETFKTILRSSEAIYTAKSDATNLQYLAMLRGMDTASMDYAGYCFAHAMSNGFYTPKARNAEAQAVYARLKTDTLAPYLSRMTRDAPYGFWKAEHYTTLDLTPALRQLRARGTRLYGLYGKEDGLYAPGQVAALSTVLGADRVKYLDSCSHNVFMDQQTVFIQSVRDWVR